MFSTCPWYWQASSIDAASESLAGYSDLCRKAPNCLRRGPAGFRSCNWTCSGSPPTSLFPPSQGKEGQRRVDQQTVLAFQWSSAAGRSWHNTHHVGSVNGGGHLDFPVVMAVRKLFGAADGSRAAAIVGVEIHLPVVAAEEGSRGLALVVPLPVETWCEQHIASITALRFSIDAGNFSHR